MNEVKLAFLTVLLICIPVAAVIVPPMWDKHVNGSFDTKTGAIRPGINKAVNEARREWMSREIKDFNYKTCPFCKEHIKPAASVCRYCQRDMPGWAQF